MSWKQSVFKQIFYFETGKGKVVGRAYMWWNELLIIFIFFKQFGFNLQYWQMILITVIGMLVVYLSGRWYINHDYHKFETSFYNKQNPEILKIMESVKDDTKNKRMVKKVK